MRTNLAFMFVVLSSIISFAGVNRQEINQGWKFRQEDKFDSLPAIVPGTIHQDLLQNKIIPDPFIATNENSVQWIDKLNWIYETDFNLNIPVNSGSNISLIFEGIDTYADVWLNDSLILKANNMFRRWEIPVKHIIKKKDNHLKILLYSPILNDIPKFDSLPFQYYAGNDQSEIGEIGDKKLSVFARKAPYHYGWDWGPRLVTSGIWRPVYIETWNGPVIKDVFISTDSIIDNCAKMSGQIEIFSDESIKNYELVISDTLSDKRTLVKERVDLIKGSNVFTVGFNIKNPKLWWSRGHGEPHMYEFDVSLWKDKKQISSFKRKTGIRKIQLIRNNDEDGKSFYFNLNGVPVFAKGANYIPQDSFLPRVTPERYKNILEAAADANMNMLRVWGGGIYENDLFYDICDSLGLMVWQDFMFACSLYPGDNDFIKNIKEEAKDNIRRLRNHPSVVLWCGNNEVLEAWQYWGIKKNYSMKGFDKKIWEDYVNLFHCVLPEAVEKYSRGIPYWASSPSDGETESRNPAFGDSHFWNVWGWEEPIEVYDSLKGRFISEFGFQSFPDFSTVKKYVSDPEQYSIDSKMILAHQRAGKHANKRLKKYILDWYRDPKDFNSFIYLSQVIQADAVKRGIESHIRNKPYCMGSLYWQLNDCWPAASWSGIDYYGKKKALHYNVKKAFDNILISIVEKNDSIVFHIIPSLNERVKGEMEISTFTIQGKKLYERTINIEIEERDIFIYTLPKKLLIGDLPENEVIIFSEFNDFNKKYSNTFLLKKPKDIHFPKPDIHVNIIPTDFGYKISLKSNNYVKSLQLSLFGEEATEFSDNYFDLIPDKDYVVTLKSDIKIPEIEYKLKFFSVYDATN